MCFQVVLAYEVIVLFKCSGKYIDICFKLKITCFAIVLDLVSFIQQMIELYCMIFKIAKRHKNEVKMFELELLKNYFPSTSVDIQKCGG